MRKSNVLLFLFVATALFSCEKDLNLDERSMLYCRENIILACSEPKGERFFSGKINGMGFCVSEGVEHYWVQNGILTGFFTSTQNPVLSPGATPAYSAYRFAFYPPVIDGYNGLIKELAPYVQLQTPAIKDSNIMKASEYIEKFIKKGDLKLRSLNADQYSGFDLFIGWRCTMRPGYNYYYQKNPERIPSVGIGLTPWHGLQNDAIFRVSTFEKIETPESVTYNITFEIECDLYYADSDADYAYYGRLTDGIFKTSVTLLPHE